MNQRRGNLTREVRGPGKGKEVKEKKLTIAYWDLYVGTDSSIWRCH